MNKILRFSAALVGTAFLSGCSTLPASGPSTSTMLHTQDADVVDVTPDLAWSLETQLQTAQQDDVARALASLQLPADDPTLTFAPGDELAITMWSFSPWTEDSASGLTQSNAPASSQLGSFVVASDGSITLPYIGNVSLAGLNLPQAQALIASRYAAQKIVEDPSVTITPLAVPQGSVIVTGSVGNPKIIPWTPAGITLASAITQALGNGTDTLSQSSDLTVSKSAIKVEVVRGSQAPVELPLDVAIEHNIALQPNDTIVVIKAPAIEVTVLGAGVKSNGMFAYAGAPALSEVLAEASGLNGYVADDHAVFVMRRRPGQTPVLYDFAWNDVSGMVAAQQFPVLNGDIVYVSEAPIVSVEAVINILFQIAVPAQVLK